MIGFIKRSVRNQFDYIRAGLRAFQQDKLYGLGALVSLLTIIAALVCFVVLIIQFATGEGFASPFSDFMTARGNAGMYYEMPIFGILGGLNLALIIISYLYFFKNEGTGLRILGAIPFVVMIVSFLTIQIRTVLSARHIIDRHGDTSLEQVMAIAFLVAMVCSIILLLVREREVSRSSLRVLIFSFVVIPALTYCIENIVMMIAFVVIFGVLSSLLGGLGEEGTSSAAASSGFSPAVREKPKSFTGLTDEQKMAIADINRRYKEGTTAIVRSHNEVGAFMFSDATNREIKQLREQLEKEAIAKGVKGKVSIY